MLYKSPQRFLLIRLWKSITHHSWSTVRGLHGPDKCVLYIDFFPFLWCSFVVFLLFVNEQSTLKCANQIYAMLFDNRINFSVRCCCSDWKQNSKRENEMLTPSNNSGKKYVRDEKKRNEVCMTKKIDCHQENSRSVRGRTVITNGA